VKGFQSYLIYYRPAGDDLVRFLHGARDLPRLLEDET
jgi:plasmid stabilization system protein ParE